jgi:phospholipid N-methyltransferase
MTTETVALIVDEIEVLAALVPLAGQDIIELGCGAAALARTLLSSHPDSRMTALEVDERQHAQNLAAPQPGLRFMPGVAQAIPGRGTLHAPDARARAAAAGVSRAAPSHP